MVLVTYPFACFKAIKYNQKSNLWYPISFESKAFSRQTISRLQCHIISNHHMVIIRAKILRDLLVLDCKGHGQFFLLFLLLKQPVYKPSLMPPSALWENMTWTGCFWTPKVWTNDAGKVSSFVSLLLYLCKPLSSAVPCCSYRMSPRVCIYRMSHWAVPDESDLLHGSCCSCRTEIEKEEFHHCDLAIYQ